MGSTTMSTIRTATITNWQEHELVNVLAQDEMAFYHTERRDPALVAACGAELARRVGLADATEFVATEVQLRRDEEMLHG